jgi:hypothetical protein
MARPAPARMTCAEYLAAEAITNPVAAIYA